MRRHMHTLAQTHFLLPIKIVPAGKYVSPFYNLNKLKHFNGKKSKNKSKLNFAELQVIFAVFNTTE